MKTYNLTEEKYIREFLSEGKKRSDSLIDYFLIGLFGIGLLLSMYYDTWLVAVGAGGLSLAGYYSSKLILPGSDFYQYVLSVVLGVFMAQFIYQMHGMFEMHFFAFIGSAILITYQNWKLQLPLVLFVVMHHAVFAYLQFSGFEGTYFTRLEFMDLQTFIIHVLLAAIIFFLCGLWAYNFRRSSLSHIRQSFEIGKLQEAGKQKEMLISERRLAEEAIIKSEKQYRQIVETAQEGIWMLDKNNRTAFVNKKMCEILGYQADEMMGKTNFDFMDEEMKSFAKQSIERRKHGVKESFELRFVSKNGKTVWVNLSTNPVLDDHGNYNGALAMVTDITEKKLADEKIIQTERLLSEAQQLAKVGNWNVDMVHNDIFWSDGLRNIKGVDADFEPSFEAFVSLIHPDDKERVVGEIMKLRQAENFLENEYRIIRPDNKEVKVIHSLIRAVKNQEGHLIRLYGISQDVTELKHAQEALENTLKELEQRVEARTRDLFISRELFSKTLQSLGDAVISTDAKGTVVFMNSSAEFVTGRNLTEAKGKSIEFVCMMINEGTGRPIDNPVNIALRENRQVSSADNTILYRNDGTFHYIDHNASPIHNDRNEIVGSVLIFRDVTEKTMNLKRLRSAHREIEEKNRSTMDSILYSKRIQEATLPRIESLTKLCPESFVLYKPKDIVSGDFYWLAKSDNRLIIAVADCTGHGVPGAFMSIIGSSLLNEIVYRNKITRPSEILKKLNSRVRRFLKSDKAESQTQDGMDIAICSIDAAHNVIEFSGANRPLIHFNGNELEIIKGNRYGVGGIQTESERDYVNHEIPFSKDDSIYMFTDGFGDQFGGKFEKKLMSSNVIDMLKANRLLNMQEQRQILNKKFEEWKGDLEQTDDVLLLGLKLDIYDAQNNSWFPAA